MKIEYEPCDYTNSEKIRQLGLLYEKIFSLKLDSGFVFWQRNNPWGDAMGVLARDIDTDRIVGHFGTMAVGARIREQELKGRVSLGFMVDDSYRGQRIAQGLYQHLFARLKNAGTDFVIGIPNDVSFNMHIKHMSYKWLRDYCFVIFPKADEMLPEEFTAVEKIEEKSYFERLTKNHILHAPDFLNWRYANKDYRFYRSAKGHIFVYTLFADKADILFWDERATEDEVLSFAQFLYRENGVNRVCSWNSFPWTKKYAHERRKYHFCINVLTEDEEVKEALPGDWDFFMGDCELF